MSKNRNYYRKDKIISILEENRDIYLSAKDIYVLISNKYKYTTVKSAASIGQILRSFDEVEKIKRYNKECNNPTYYYKLK